MQLNPDAFARHLDNFAEPFVYRKAYACPCQSPTSGSPDRNCQLCAGKGWLWAGTPVNTTAAVASSGVQMQWAKMGSYESGDLVLSIPYTSALYEIGQFDRVLALTSTDSRSIVLTRGGTREVVHGVAKQALRVFWADPQNANKIVDGSLPKIDATGVPSWPEGGAPPVGLQYSLTYDRYVEYYCFGPFSSDRNKHGGLPLPRKMVMRRFDLMGRSPTPGSA